MKENPFNPSPVNFGNVLGVLEDMQDAGIIEKFSIGGAVAAILHYEPISTIDLDIFFFLADKSENSILSLTKIYDYAASRGFSLDHEFINIHGWLVQFIEASQSPLWTEAIEKAELMTIENFQVLVIGREHLAAMWIFAGRKKDIQKIEMFDEARIMNAGILYDILLRHNLLTNWRQQQHNFSDEYQF